VTPAVLDRPMSLSDRPLPGGGVTLEERLNSVLDEARTNGSSECPVCHARVTPTLGGHSGATPARAACGGCGSRVS
jgi:hypothetical protein